VCLRFCRRDRAERGPTLDDLQLHLAWGRLVSPDTDVLINRADIARLAGVQRPAVTNWGRRYPDFPRPVTVNAGVELFRAADVAAWLSSRKIPRDARLAGEPEGITYGDRLRRNLPQLVDLGPAQLGRSIVEVLTEPAKLDAFRDVLDIGEHRDLLLILVHAAACRPTDWSKLVQSANRSSAEFLGELRTVLTMPDLGPFTEFFRAVMATAHRIELTKEVVRAIDKGVDGTPVGRTSLLWHVFGGLLERFAERAGGRGVERYTPPSVTRLAARILKATGGGTSVYDPFCRSGEFLSAVVAEVAGNPVDPSKQLRVEGRHPRAATSQVAELHLNLLGLSPVVRPGLSLADPPRASYDIVVSNPPFNMRIDEHMLQRHTWTYGKLRNANFAWLQHVVSAMSPEGRGAVLMPNNACFSTSKSDRAIRADLVERGYVVSLVALPSQLFAGTAVPATLWVLAKQRPVSDEILFLDASSMGTLVSRTSRVLGEDELSEVEKAFRAWWSGDRDALLENRWARRVTLEEIRSREYSLNPLSYVDFRHREEEVEKQLAQVQLLSVDLRRLRVRVAEVSGGALEASRLEHRSNDRRRTRAVLIGDVPDSWDEVPLGRLADIQAGPKLSKAGTVSKDVPVVQPRDLRDGWIAGETVKPEPASEELVHRYGLRPGDVLCARTGELGRHGLVEAEHTGWLFGTGLLRVRPRPGILPNYLAHYLGLSAVREWIIRHASGTAVPTINQTILAELPVVLPPLSWQEDIGRVMDVARDEARLHEQLARLATRHRQVLGPLLMTGVLSPRELPERT